MELPAGRRHSTCTRRPSVTWSSRPPPRDAQADTLTPRERRTAELSAQGHPVAVAAKEMHLTGLVSHPRHSARVRPSQYGSRNRRL